MVSTPHRTQPPPPPPPPLPYKAVPAAATPKPDRAVPAATTTRTDVHLRRYLEQAQRKEHAGADEAENVGARGEDARGSEGGEHVREYITCNHHKQHELYNQPTSRSNITCDTQKRNRKEDKDAVLPTSSGARRCDTQKPHVFPTPTPTTAARRRKTGVSGPLCQQTTLLH